MGKSEPFIICRTYIVFILCTCNNLLFMHMRCKYANNLAVIMRKILLIIPVKGRFLKDVWRKINKEPCCE